MASTKQATQPDTPAIRCARKMVDLALDHRNPSEFHRHAAHLKALKAAERRRRR